MPLRWKRKKTALYLLVRFQLPWLEPHSWAPQFDIVEPIRKKRNGFEANKKAL